MRSPDDVIRILEDEQWHTQKDISEKTQICPKKVEKVFDFLTQFGIAEKKGLKVKLSTTFFKDCVEM